MMATLRSELAESGRFVLTTPSFLYVTIFNIPAPFIFKIALVGASDS
jgi:hypothetical protein